MIDGLPPDAPELDLARRLSAYQDLRERRIAQLPNRQKAQARLVFSGLQQRLLRLLRPLQTLAVHRRTLERLIADAEPAEHAAVEAAEAFARAEVDQENGELPFDEDEAEAQQEADEVAAAEQASLLGALGAEPALGRSSRRSTSCWRSPSARRPARTRGSLADVLDLREPARPHRWNDRRLIVFTEWEDTRRWLEQRLKEAIVETDLADERIAVFSGITGTIAARRSSRHSTRTPRTSRYAS